MKICIISDTHDNLPNLRKVVRWCERSKVELIIHCGDVARPDTVKSVLGEFSGDFLISLGNGDEGFGWERELLEEPFRGKVFVEYGEVEVKGSLFAFTHHPDMARKLMHSGRYEVVFHGHTHKPDMRGAGKEQIVCPGNLAGMRFRASFAFWDTETGIFELKAVDRI